MGEEKRSRRDLLARSAMVLTAAFIGASSAMFATSMRLGDVHAADVPAREARSPFQEAMQSNYKNLFEAALVSGAQQRNGASIPTDRLLAIASRDGMQRLDDGSISDLIRLRAELARRSDTATCAGIWTGATGPGLVPAIERLPPDQQRQWAALFNRAAEATINHTPIRPAPTPEQYQPALQRMMSALPAADVRAINTAIGDSAHVTPEQECAAVRAFYGGMTQARPADALTLTRALLYQ